MAQQDRPQRSLRKDGGGPRYYRDWGASQQAPEPPEAPEIPDEDEYLEDPQELHMVEGFDPEAPPAPPPSHELAPLNVIVPEMPLPGSEAPKAAKPTITRVDGSKLQRARRKHEIEAEETAQKEEAAREAAARKAPPDQSPRTRNLSKTSAQTTELQTNIKEIEGKLDEAKENVKSTANALSENIRQISEKITVTVVGSIQQISKGLNGLIARMGGKSVQGNSRRDDDPDFDDEPMPGQPAGPRGTGRTAELPEPPPGYGQPKAPPKEENLLDRVGPIPPVQYADLLKEGVTFLTFEKQPLVENPQDFDPQPLQAHFVESALQDIRKCIKLVRDLPDPTEGPYSGIPMAYIFKQVRDQDLYYFMHYVLSKPEPFRKKTFKISEAFATWILKRSASTVISEAPFPEVPSLAYWPLYQNNVRFQTFDKKQLVLAAGKSPDEVEALFLERALEDVRNCVSLVEKFPSAAQGPYKNRPLKQIFKGVKPRDIYFFLHYVRSQPEVFSGQNFKFAEAFASWILKRSHETEISG